MVYANPAPAGMASGEFYDTEGASYYLSAAKLESDYADIRFERELKLFRQFCPRGAVLDVGCSSGAFLFQLKRRWPGDYEILGTDVSGAPLDYAESRGVPVLRGNFLAQDFVIRPNPETPNASHPVPPNEPPPHPSLSLDGGGSGIPPAEEALQDSKVQSVGFCPGNSLPIGWGEGDRRPAEGFDAVTFWAVLEHLAEPRQFLEKARSILRPGGLCFVLVPNLRSLAVRLLGAKYRYVYPQHLNYFTKLTLTRLAMESGFALAQVRFTHFNPVVIWQDWRGGGRNISNQERGELLKRTTAYKQKSWLKPVKAAYQLAEKSLAAFGLADNLVAVLSKR